MHAAYYLSEFYLRMRPKLVILDCDGVLVMNTNEIYDEALRNTVSIFAPEYPSDALAELMERTRGKTFDHQLRSILGSDDIRLTRAIETYEQYLHREDVYSRVTLLAGASRALEELKQLGYILALATGMNPSLLDRLFADRLLPDMFTFISSVHEISDPKFQKPHPKTLQKVLFALNRPAKESLYVGDTIDDVLMARSCSIFSIAVLTGRLTRKVAIDAGAELVLNSVLELPPWLLSRSPIA